MPTHAVFFKRRNTANGENCEGPRVTASFPNSVTASNDATDNRRNMSGADNQPYHLITPVTPSKPVVGGPERLPPPSYSRPPSSGHYKNSYYGNTETHPHNGYPRYPVRKAFSDTVEEPHYQGHPPPRFRPPYLPHMHGQQHRPPREKSSSQAFVDCSSRRNRSFEEFGHEPVLGERVGNRHPPFPFPGGNHLRHPMNERNKHGDQNSIAQHPRFRLSPQRPSDVTRPPGPPMLSSLGPSRKVHLAGADVNPYEHGRRPLYQDSSIPKHAGDPHAKWMMKRDKIQQGTLACPPDTIGKSGSGEIPSSPSSVSSVSQYSVPSSRPKSFKTHNEEETNIEKAMSLNDQSNSNANGSTKEEEKEMINDALLLTEVAAMARTEVKTTPSDTIELSHRTIQNERKDSKDSSSFVPSLQNNITSVAQDRIDTRKLTKTPPLPTLKEEPSMTSAPITPSSSSATIVTSNPPSNPSSITGEIQCGGSVEEENAQKPAFSQDAIKTTDHKASSLAHDRNECPDNSSARNCNENLPRSQPPSLPHLGPSVIPPHPMNHGSKHEGNRIPSQNPLPKNLRAEPRLDTYGDQTDCDRWNENRGRIAQRRHIPTPDPCQASEYDYDPPPYHHQRRIHPRVNEDGRVQTPPPSHTSEGYEQQFNPIPRRNSYYSHSGNEDKEYARCVNKVHSFSNPRERGYSCNEISASNSRADDYDEDAYYQYKRHEDDRSLAPSRSSSSNHSVPPPSHRYYPQDTYSPRSVGSGPARPIQRGPYPGPPSLNRSGSQEYYQSPGASAALPPQRHPHHRVVRPQQLDTLPRTENPSGPNNTVKRQFETPITPGIGGKALDAAGVSQVHPDGASTKTGSLNGVPATSSGVSIGSGPSFDEYRNSPYPRSFSNGYHPHPNHSQGHCPPNVKKTILRRKCAWKNYPELEAFLIANREEYLRHSAMNYTVQQKQYNNRLTERLLEVAANHNYVFDENDFNFVAVRDRIRCYYKSYVQSSKKRGIIVGYSTQQQSQPAKKRKVVSESNESKNNLSENDKTVNSEVMIEQLNKSEKVEQEIEAGSGSLDDE